MINRTILLKQINEKFYKHFAYILQILLKYRGIIIDVDTYIIINNEKKKIIIKKIVCIWKMHI